MNNMWNLHFISREQFKEHVKETIKKYGEVLNPINLCKFNHNIIDPIKLTFDSKVYQKSMEQIIVDEIGRQRDKSNNNAIGYFHQNIFKYINGCVVPDQGWDVVYTKPDGLVINVEMKNKHNTMNSSSSQKTYMRMMNQILNSNDVCYLVEVIARHSQNIVWTISLDGTQMRNERIKRVSIDKFYEEITGDRIAFKKICDALPEMIDEIISENEELTIGRDTVLDELYAIDPNYLKSLYLLAFETYEGFNQ